MVAKKKKGWAGQTLGVFALITAIVLMPTTIIIVFGMLPTVVATFFDKAHKRTRAITVGFINLAGCTPFVLHLWYEGHVIENAVEIALDPRAVIVMWSSAGIGYIIDWAMSGIVSTVMLDRGKSRHEDIQKLKESLVKRWGPEVTGDLALDNYGFPIHKYDLEDNSDDVD